MTKSAKFLCPILIALLIMIVHPGISFGQAPAGPAYFYVSARASDDEAYLDADIRANTGGQNANVASFTLRYPADKLELQAFDLTDSFCELFPEIKNDPTQGEIMITCGRPNPGFSGDDQIVRAQFAVKEKGWTELTFSPDAIMLANDGRATDILEFAVGKTVITE